MKNKLTPKQKKFADEWIKSNNATQSAIKAGYSKKTAQAIGAENLTKPLIRDYISKRTAKVQQKDDADVDAVLTNIYKMASGKEISDHKTIYDNDKGELISDKTFTQPAPQKQQIAAAELWMRIKGQFKNDNAEIEKAKTRKLNAEAEIAEAKAKEETDQNNSHVNVNITMPGDPDASD